MIVTHRVTLPRFLAQQLIFGLPGNWDDRNTLVIQCRYRVFGLTGWLYGVPEESRHGGACAGGTGFSEGSPELPSHRDQRPATSHATTTQPTCFLCFTTQIRPTINSNFRFWIWINWLIYLNSLVRSHRNQPSNGCDELHYLWSVNIVLRLKAMFSLPLFF